MSFDSSGREPSSNPNADGQRDRPPISERWGTWQANEEDTFVDPQFPEFIHREHVSGPLPADPSEAPIAHSPPPPSSGYGFQDQASPSPHPYPPEPQQMPGHSPAGVYSGYPVYPGYQGYQEYAPGYGYPPYVYPPYVWQQPRPKRDNYQFVLAIISVVGSSLVLLAGLICLLIVSLFTAVPHPSLSASEYFTGLVLFVAFACSGVLGGIFGLYHSIRALLQKPSSAFKLPTFWLFVLLYLLVVAAGYVLQSQGAEVTSPGLTILLIVLAAIFPGLAVLALGVRRLRFPTWPTSWRRFTLAVVSGATAGIVLAGLLELGLGQLFIRGAAGVNPIQCIDHPDLQGCQDPNIYILILIIVAVIAPLVEEAVKPLAVVALIGRLRSAAEAFVLGLACGVGFDLVETSGYIGAGYHDWLTVALVRSGASLLHGFGAAMVALGWYYLTHAKRHRLLLALACWSYAVLQHAIWNGSWGVVLLPDPVGHFFDSWRLNLGFTMLTSYEVINIVEALLMLAFFIYMTGRLRKNVKMEPAGVGTLEGATRRGM